MNVESSLASVGETAAAAQPGELYLRASIPGDREVEPYELTGHRRTVFLFVYGTIVATAIAGLAYLFYFDPVFAVAALALGYCFENLAFCCGHVGFHAEFIDNPEPEMKTLSHNSFLHHYRNRSVFHERWLETRMSYFIDPQAVFKAKAFVKLFVVGSVFLVLAYVVHPALAVAVYAAQAGPLLIQSTVHEWYHNPPRNRASFYSPPAYWLFTFLERISIASTSTHMVHHQHGLKDLDHVHKWMDLYMPFGDALPSRLWQKSLAVYEPGKSRMTQFAMRGLPFRLFVGFRLAATATIVGAYFVLAT